MKLNRTQVMIGGGVLAVVVIALFAFFLINRPDAIVAQVDGAQSAVADAPGTLAYDPNAPIMEPGPLGEMALGNPDAPNVVIEYASMTCSHCRSFHEEIFDDFVEKYVDTGQVYFIMREFPLDPLANAAIMLARCAPEERFFPIIKLMFEQQRNWAFVDDPANALRKLVNQAGISDEQFQACLTNQEILDGVTVVRDRGADEFGVGSTPTFFVNGERYSGVQRLEDFDAILGG